MKKEFIPLLALDIEVDNNKAFKVNTRFNSDLFYDSTFHEIVENFLDSFFLFLIDNKFDFENYFEENSKGEV